ncbi:hypothetical protein jhhlp_007271 [Lomentospora prolificans]|uniref:Uncharacterized protein n=1 Tax=Lomentospora prolificans TaxID=41688 RepID=A0A2N3N278_9PEZI|nr:hypothetical protein jhhlp_007271 [Lomentospora prolificans]
MCRPATCNTCVPDTRKGKKTWWGCGNHIPAVMDSVDKAEWCSCEPRVERGGQEYPPMAKQAS